MTSPSKRPAVTYHRGPRNKIPASSLKPEDESAFKSSSLLLNPDAALQQKINDLLFSKEERNGISAYQEEEEEFDSAYHETTGNAKKVHDLVQVGETRRFIDEIEYLLDGLTLTGPKSLPTVRSSLQEIVQKCFNTTDKISSVNVAFGMKLKSHGALGIIFESLNEVDDPIIFDNLILLISGLLYDVRRLDFFFKPELAIKLARHCLINDYRRLVTEENIVTTKLKCTQVFKDKEAQDLNPKESFLHVGIWILYKCSFSSVTSAATTRTTDTTSNTTNTDTDSKSFFNLLIGEINLLTRLLGIISDSPVKIGEQAAGLMDCLLNNRKGSLTNVLKDDLITLLKTLTCSKNLIFMKLAVSITGSPIGKDLAQENSTVFFEIVKKLIEISLPSRGQEIEILSLSSLINLIDRCDDSVLDEFRYQKLKDDCLLGYLGREFSECKTEGSMQKSLLALLLGFLCRQNRTNLQVMLQDRPENELKKEIFTVASNFLLQQEKMTANSVNVEEDNKIIIERLKEIVLTFK